MFSMSVAGAPLTLMLVKPGPQPAIAITPTIDGEYEQMNPGRLEIDLAGTMAGLEHDQLIVSGTATLGGTLKVNFLPGLSEPAGAIFDIVDAGQIIGDFDAFNLPKTRLGEPLLDTMLVGAGTLRLVALQSIPDLPPTGGATSVNLYLDVDSAAGTWEVYVSIEDPGGNSLGLSRIFIDVTSDGDVTIETAKNELPAPAETTDSQIFFQKGFRLFASDGDLGVDPDTGLDRFFGIGGIQDNTSDELSPAGTGNDAIVVGVALIPVTEDNGTLPATEIAHPVLAASGTFSGTNGTVIVTPAFDSTFLIPTDFREGQSFGTDREGALMGDSIFIPEPGVVSLIFFGGILALARSHSRRDPHLVQDPRSVQ